MDTQKKQLLEMKRRELAFTKYFKKFESIHFLILKNKNLFGIKNFL